MFEQSYLLKTLAQKQYLYIIHGTRRVFETKTLQISNYINLFFIANTNYTNTFNFTKCIFQQLKTTVSAEGREGPLFDICGALWVPLQCLHHLTMFQHQSHQLILALNFTYAGIHRTNQLQLQQMLKRLKTHRQSCAHLKVWILSNIVQSKYSE